MKATTSWATKTPTQLKDRQGDGMFLGRSTPQWLGLITAITGALQIALPILLPGMDPVQLTVVLGAITAILGALIAFIANTSTTPVKDPQLQEGTMVRVTDKGGTVIGHLPVPSPVSVGAGNGPAPGG